jgi:hypothetical protein
MVFQEQKQLYNSPLYPSNFFLVMRTLVLCLRGYKRIVCVCGLVLSATFPSDCSKTARKRDLPRNTPPVVPDQTLRFPYIDTTPTSNHHLQVLKILQLRQRYLRNTHLKPQKQILQAWKHPLVQLSPFIPESECIIIDHRSLLCGCR